MNLRKLNPFSRRKPVADDPVLMPASQPDQPIDPTPVPDVPIEAITEMPALEDVAPPHVDPVVATPATPAPSPVAPANDDEALTANDDQIIARLKTAALKKAAGANEGAAFKQKIQELAGQVEEANRNAATFRQQAQSYANKLGACQQSTETLKAAVAALRASNARLRGALSEALEILEGG